MENAPASGNPGPQPARRTKTILLLAVGLIVLVPIAAAFIMPAMAEMRGHRNLEQCRRNLQVVGDAVVAYAQKNGGVLPDSLGLTESWSQSLRRTIPEDQEPPHCPGFEGYYGFGVGYALNPAFFNKKVDDPALRNEPLLIECETEIPSSQWRGNARRAGRRHVNGAKFNRYYVGRGALTEQTPPYEGPPPKPVDDAMSGGPGGGRISE